MHGRSLLERAAEGADPGPRFAMEFARATNEVLSRIRGGSARPASIVPVPPAPETGRNTMVRETHLALRDLAKPSRLAESHLIGRLPRTLEAARQDAGVSSTTMSSLEQARLLRTVLIAAIERLGAGDSGRPDFGSDQHTALYERYVMRRLVNAIITDHGIGEGTFHRHRQDGIGILAESLAEYELHLGGSVDTSPATAARLSP